MIHEHSSFPDIVALHVEVSRSGEVKVERAYGGNYGFQIHEELEKRIKESIASGPTGFMGLDEFQIMYEVLQKYHPSCHRKQYRPSLPQLVQTLQHS